MTHFFLLFAMLVYPDISSADASGAIATTNLNAVWTLTAAMLVFLMQAGFTMVEIGLTRAKNAINIIMKNVVDFAVGTISFFLIGFVMK